MDAFKSVEQGIAEAVELAIKAYALTSGGVCPERLPEISAFRTEPAYEYGLGCLRKDGHGEALCSCPWSFIYTCHDAPENWNVVSAVDGYLLRRFGYCAIPVWMYVVAGLVGFICLCGMCCCAYRSVSSDPEEESLEKYKARRIDQRDQPVNKSGATQPMQAGGAQPTQAQAQYYQGDQYSPQPDQASVQDIDPFLTQAPAAQPHDVANQPPSAAQGSDVQRQGSLPPPLPPS
eukprot:TRINITY_DN1701_c0_g1_i3.p1 TRINITY_DN1701_c0_g1~~TRINITY_DN1701_c0_g1_i3.p1  ORF type:complete len:233 (+),score=26.39 TRINITY_DN1701_c0_g1_i3:277-975(+)